MYLRINELNCTQFTGTFTTMSGSMENGTVVYCGQGLDDFHTR